MDVAITDINEVEKEITIHASATELLPHFDKAYQKHRAKIELKGFRKGKAPLDLVKKLHGEAIVYDSLSEIATDFYRKVISDRDIHPIGEPVLTDMQYKPGEDLSFKVKYQIKPVVVLKEYKKIPVELVKHIVTEKEIQDEILRIRRASSTAVEVDSATDENHIITTDIQEVDTAGNPIIGKKTPDVRVYLADEAVYPEIRGPLRNIARGATAKAVIMRNVEDKQQPTHVELHAKKVERVNLPELDDTFVKKITRDKVGTVEEFVTGVRKDIEHYWNDRSDRKLTDDLIGEVVRRHDVTVPDSMVKGILDSMLEDLKNRYPNKKLPSDFKEDEFREQNRSYAVFQAKWFLIRERIIETEGITATDAEIEQKAEEDAPRMGIDKSRLLQFYKTSGSVRDRIVSEKLIEFLKQNAFISERSTEEFTI
jgi:trigger factor